MNSKTLTWVGVILSFHFVGRFVIPLLADLCVTNVLLAFSTKSIGWARTLLLMLGIIFLIGIENFWLIVFNLGGTPVGLIGMLFAIPLRPFVILFYKRALHRYAQWIF